MWAGGRWVDCFHPPLILAEVSLKIIPLNVLLVLNAPHPSDFPTALFAALGTLERAFRPYLYSLQKKGPYPFWSHICDFESLQNICFSFFSFFNVDFAQKMYPILIHH